MATIASSWKNNDEKKTRFLSLDIMKWYLLCLLSTPPFHFIVRERQEMSGFRQWAWVMVSMSTRYRCVSFFPPASLPFLSSIRENFSFVEGRGGGRGKDNRSRRNERLWRAYIVCERQRTQHSATERRATATKRVASVLMPQLNRHLISLDRTAVADERNWACLGVRQPYYHESESRTAKFYGVRLRFSSWRCHDGFLTKTAYV